MTTNASSRISPAEHRAEVRRTSLQVIMFDLEQSSQALVARQLTSQASSVKDHRRFQTTEERVKNARVRAYPEGNTFGLREKGVDDRIRRANSRKLHGEAEGVRIVVYSRLEYRCIAAATYLGVIVTKREPFGQGMEWRMHLLQNIIINRAGKRRRTSLQTPITRSGTAYLQHDESVRALITPQTNFFRP